MTPSIRHLPKALLYNRRFVLANFSRSSAIACLVFSVLVIPAAGQADSRSPLRANPHAASELRGSIPAADGLHLKFVTDLGNVVIRTQEARRISYRIHLEADTSQPDARSLLKSFRIVSHRIPEGIYLHGAAQGCRCQGRLWVTVDLAVPRNLSLDVSTGGGNIQAGDLGAAAILSTAGGNITVGNVAGAARLTSESGGHISVRDVAGDLTASTGGGHITAGSISGDAILHTTGGHIRVSSVGGTAHFDTGGGNVTLEHSGAGLDAETTGGEIEVGDASGLVRASTGGGGIRLVRASGPANLQTPSGSIYLTQVNGAVRASTGAGGITAWFTGSGKALGPCQLQSNDGDIVVYLPRELPITIDARVQLGADHRVVIDPAFPLKVSYDVSNGNHSIRAEGALNGGGQVLHLRTIAGNIRVEMSDAVKQADLYRQQMQQIQDQMKQVRQQIQMQMRLFEAMHPADEGEQPGQPAQDQPH